MRYQVAIGILSAVCVLTINGDNSCPNLPQCVCYKDKTSVNCNGKHFTDLPTIPKTAERLYFKHNNVTILSTGMFSGLPNLQILYLDSNKISKIEPFAFDGLVMLNHLVLRGNLLNDLGTNSLANLSNLEKLELNNNMLKTVAENAFNRTSSLTYVNFQANNLSAIPPLGHQPHLSQIILEGNDIVDATFPSSFKTCSRNTGIVLSYNVIGALKNSTFKALANSTLTKLYLSGNIINSVDTGTFSEINSIKSLHLGFNPLNSLILKNAVAGLAGKDIQSLDLSGTELNGELMEDTFSLLKNTTLNHLVLRSNKIKLLRDNTFSRLKSLTMLDLSKNKINDASSQAFSGLEQLSTLKLNDNRFELVPKQLPPSLHFLYLEKNQIHKLENNAFENLAQLRVLRLRRNNILTLERDAFNGLTNLKTLNLNNNHINTLPGTLFTPLEGLKRLELGKNYLSQIQYTKGIFSSLVALTYLNLADNQCTFLPNDIFEPTTSLIHLHLERNNLGKLLADDHRGRIFENLKNLEELYLMNNNIEALPGPMLKNQISLKLLAASNNKLTTWESNLFKSTKKLATLDLSYNLINTVEEKHIQYFNNLKYLNLTGSPFTCNCDLRWFRDWIDQTKTVLSNSASYTCNGPRGWKRRPLLEFSRREINCTFFSKYAIIGLVCAAMVVAFIICGLVYRTRWRLRLRWYRLSRRGRLFLKRTKATDNRSKYGAIEDDSKIFDAYVSCSESDRPWALLNLLPGIDNGQLNDNNKFEGDFHLYYEDRDSEPGAPLVANVMEHMVKSRKVIVVLSVNYFNGMNEFELDQATTLLHDHEIEDIIVIKRGDIPARKVPKHLYRQMRTGMFIEWEDDENAKETFRGKLIERLKKGSDE